MSYAAKFMPLSWEEPAASDKRQVVCYCSGSFLLLGDSESKCLTLPHGSLRINLQSPQLNRIS